MTIFCPNKNDHMPHRPCPDCNAPQYRADNGVWSHCITGVLCPASPEIIAAELVRQYDNQAGPKPGDPFDMDVWAWHAAALLRTLGGNSA